MRDKITVERVKLLHPDFRPLVIKAIDGTEAELPVRVAIRMVEGFRSFETQENYYKIGRTVMGKNPTKKKPMGQTITNAKAGQGYHAYGLAGDFAILYDMDANGTFEVLSWDRVKDFDKDGVPDWEEMVKVFESFGFTWGGRWATIVDAPHFQQTFGYNWKELLAKYNSGDFIPGTKFVNLKRK